MTLEPPGRGRRIAEPLLTDLPQMVDDFLQKLEGYPPERLFFYGHSMGAMAAYLTAHRLRELGASGPKGLIVSGRAGPSASKGNGRTLHRLPSDALAVELAAYGAIPHEILADPELMSFFEPMLRADFQAVEEYRHAPLPPLPLPITLLVGEKDIVSEERAMAWERESTLPLSVHRFAGGHFFIFEEPDRVADVLSGVVLAR